MRVEPSLIGAHPLARRLTERWSTVATFIPRARRASGSGCLPPSSVIICSSPRLAARLLPRAEARPGLARRRRRQRGTVRRQGQRLEGRAGALRRQRQRLERAGVETLKLASNVRVALRGQLANALRIARRLRCLDPRRISLVYAVLGHLACQAEAQRVARPRWRSRSRPPTRFRGL